MNMQVSTDSFFIRSATSLAILTVTLLIGIMAFVFWQQHSSGIEAKRWVSHTYEVRGHIRLLHARVKDAELAQIGYLVSGDKEYLDLYEDTFRDGPAPATGTLPTDNRSSIAQELQILEELTWIFQRVVLAKQMNNA